MPATEPPGGWTDPTCPVARAADLVGDRWSLLILRDACDGTRSFTDFQRGLGVAKNILSDRLRRLVAQGILERVPAASGKRQVYALTDAGAELFGVVVSLRQWGERHAFADGEARSVLVEDATGSPVPALYVIGERGGVLTPQDTHVVKPSVSRAGGGS